MAALTMAVLLRYLPPGVVETIVAFVRASDVKAHSEDICEIAMALDCGKLVLRPGVHIARGRVTSDSGWSELQHNGKDFCHCGVDGTPYNVCTQYVSSKHRTALRNPRIHYAFPADKTMQ
jgi:hypothetical protein